VSQPEEQEPKYVIMDDDGIVRALVGSVDNDVFNAAVKAARSTHRHAWICTILGFGGFIIPPLVYFMALGVTLGRSTYVLTGRKSSVAWNLSFVCMSLMFLEWGYLVSQGIIPEILERLKF